MNIWKEIGNKEDVETLMNYFQWFHDSCIISLQYKSGNTVLDDGAMTFPKETDVVANVVLQSQFECKKIELEFIGVYRMHLLGFGENFDNGLLYGASILFLKNYKSSTYAKAKTVTAWVDYDYDEENGETIEFSYEDEEFDGSYIIASKIRWRAFD